MELDMETFYSEMNELIDDLSSTLLQLETNLTDSSYINQIFRGFHTLKGGCSLYGFDSISNFVHDIETFYDGIRSGKINLTLTAVDLSFTAVDVIKKMLTPGETVNDELKVDIIEQFKHLQLQPEGLSEFDKVPEPDVEPKPENKPLKTFRIYFRPCREFLQAGGNPFEIISQVHSLGQCSVLLNTSEIPQLDEINPELCYTSWELYLTTEKDINAVKELFIFVDNQSTLEISEQPFSKDPPKMIGEMLIDKGIVDKEKVDTALKKQVKLGEILVQNGELDPKDLASALVEQDHIKKVNSQISINEAMSNIRVASSKIDSLVDLVGEIVTVKARLTQIALILNDSRLTQIAEEVENLTSELRETTMSIRMMPVGPSFLKFNRLVRDLSKDLGKEIELLIEGQDTELDKTVLEQLGNPLMHCLRNSIDHGIELPDVRSSQGKPAKGTIKIKACHEGSFVRISIEDDGAGIDPEIISKKAIEKGILKEGVQYSMQEILDTVFLPGFSTAKTVTNISGRGVGMDVVKKTIESLRGTISLHSQKGTGTSIVLQIPLTVAIIDGLLVEAGDSFYILPLEHVEECVELAHGISGSFKEKRSVVVVRNTLIPYVRLREAFNIYGDFPAIEQVIICKSKGICIGITVDKVIGSYQTVIKKIGKVYRNIKNVSGATILGDGTVALVIDPFKMAVETEFNTVSN